MLCHNLQIVIINCSYVIIQDDNLWSNGLPVGIFSRPMAFLQIFLHGITFRENISKFIDNFQKNLPCKFVFVMVAFFLFPETFAYLQITQKFYKLFLQSINVLDLISVCMG